MGWRLLLGIAVTVAALGVACAPATAAVPAWTTYRHDAARSGIDPDSASPVTPTQAWQTPALDGEVYGEPLVYGSYVYVATENDSIYKLDAATGAVVWSKHLAAPEPSTMAPCGDISPSIGITSTPVIDPVMSRIYAVGAVLSPGESVHHELFALDLASGAKAAGYPITVDPQFPPGGTPVNQLQRPGLALAGGRVLIGYGGNAGDCNTYWGWIVSAPTDGTSALHSFQVNPGSDHGAIWAGGNAPSVDRTGNVFVATGNGTGTLSPDYGDSVVKLDAQANPLDWWAPPNWQSLDSSDADLGSSMPTLLPGGFVFQSGKDGSGYVLHGAALGHVSPPAAQASGFCSGVSSGGSVYRSESSTIYAACSGGLRALSFSAGSPPSVVAKAGFTAPSNATGPPMIAGGLVWATSSSAGILYGLDPATGAVKSQFSIPENGKVNHFQIPGAGGGRLFLASGNQVTGFTIANPPPPSATTTTLASSANPASAGGAISLTATVAPVPDAGTVTFRDGGNRISGCTGLIISPATFGREVCHTTFTRSGIHNLSVSYSGDPFYSASASAVLAQSVTSSASRGGPRISHASISPHRFTARHRPKLRVSLSEAARLTVSVTALRHGHRVTLRRLHFNARAGRRTFRLRLRHLRTGRYTAYISATDAAGARSRRLHVKFTIVAAS